MKRGNIKLVFSIIAFDNPLIASIRARIYPPEICGKENVFWDNLLHLLLFTDDQLQGYADGAKLITDDQPLLEFFTAKKVLLQNPKEVITDIDNFLKKNGK